MMSRNSFRSFVLPLLVLGLLAGCGLTVTEDRPSYEQLAPAEKDVVDVVVEELRGFNAEVERLTDVSIATIVDRERINVAFEGAIFAANLGDDLVHVSVWENLSAAQHDLVATWFGAASAEAAQAPYETVLYHLMAVSQGVKQFMYEALTTSWVYDNRSVFNVERDSVRTALAYFRDVGREAEMWPALTQACAPLLERYAPTYEATFSKTYLRDHLLSLANPDGPTGYMYYLCRWIEMGQEEATTLADDLAWLQSLRQESESP